MRFALAVVLLAATSLLPACSAQVVQPSFSLGTISGLVQPLKVDLDVAILEVPWAYNYNNALATAPSMLQTSATLSWAPAQCNQPGVILLGTYTEQVNVQPALGQTMVTGKSKFSVKVTGEAPGEMPIVCVMRAHMGAVANYPQTPDSMSSFTVVAAYRGQLAVSVPSTLLSGAAGTEMLFPIQVRNQANSETRVFVEVAPVPAGWQVVIPIPVVIGSAMTGQNNNATILLKVVAPKDGASEIPLVVKVTGSSVKDTSNALDPIHVTLVARRGGSDPLAGAVSTQGKVAPDAAPLFSVGLLAVAALARRKLA